MLIAIDLDGTLLNSSGRVSDANAAALREAVARGHVVAPATARWFQAARRPFETLGLEVPAIAAAGADVRLADSTVVTQQRLAPEFAQEIARICDESGWIATFTTPPRAYRRANELPPWAANAPEWLLPVTHLRDADLSCVLAVLAEVPDHAAALAVLAPWRDQVNVHDAISYTGDSMLTITARGSHKGTGLAALCAALAIAPEQAVAIGDSDVDLPMFEVAATRVAMANATDEVKASATLVTASADDDGVAVALRELGLA